MNKRYFHIQKLNRLNPEWNVNDTFTTQRTDSNNYYSDIANSLGESIFQFENNSIGLMNHSNLIFEKYEKQTHELDPEKQEDFYFRKSSEYETLSTNLHNNLFKSLVWIREEIFESIRESYYKDLPSRKKCIWLTDYENLQYWWKMFEETDTKKILEIEILNSGKMHLADGNFIRTETFKMSEFENLAKSYWSGKIEKKDEIEILYEGGFKIINEFKNINEI
jgi:hypothetical protein